MNLINTTTLPDSLANPAGVECSSAEEILALTTPPACNRSLTVVVKDINRTVLLNETFSPSKDPQLQQIVYMVLGNVRELNISHQVVSSGGDYYYILSLEDSLQFPMTAIPAISVNCTTPSLGGIMQNVVKKYCYFVIQWFQVSVQMILILAALPLFQERLYTS